MVSVSERDVLSAARRLGTILLMIPGEERIKALKEAAVLQKEVRWQFFFYECD